MPPINFDVTQYAPRSQGETAAIANFDKCIDDLSGAVNGTRNVTLTRAAFCGGRLVGAGIIAASVAEGRLTQAAKTCGLPAWEYGIGIPRGLNAGAKEPWVLGTTGKTSAPKPFTLTPSPQPQDNAVKVLGAKTEYERGVDVAGTRGEVNLNSRGITLIPSNVKYSVNFMGLVFPLTTPNGDVVAIQKIYLLPDGTNTVTDIKNDDGSISRRKKKLTNGTMLDSMIVFKGQAASPVILTDGPEDALAAHQGTGLTAMASCGKGRFNHAAAHLSKGDVLMVVRDADGTDAREYGKAIRAYEAKGIAAIWVDPPAPCKDVNDVLKAHGNAGVMAMFTRAYEARFPAAQPSAEAPSDGEAELGDDLDLIDTAALGGLPAARGLVRDIQAYIVRTSRHPQPNLALGAALTIIATAAGRRFSFSDMKPNIYVLGLAPSSSGKNTVLQSIERILAAAGLDALIAGKEPASGAAVISRIMEHPVSTYLIDEIGFLFKIVADPKASGHHKDIVKVWTELYTCSGGKFHDKDRANRKLSPTTHVDCPSLSIYGTSTAHKVWESITTDVMFDGSLARYLVIEPEQSYPNPIRFPERIPVPKHIIEALQSIRNRGALKSEENVASIDLPDVIPGWVDIPTTQEADDYLWELTLAETGLKRKHEHDGLGPIYGRSVEHTMKLAMISAIGRDCKLDLTVEKADVEWASQTVGILIAKFISNLKQNVAKNDQERAGNDILKLIRANPKGIDKSDITRKSRNLDSKRRDGILDDLLDSGLITQEYSETGGRGKHTYFSVTKKRGKKQ